MNFLFLGDIVGRSGRDIVLSELPKLKTNEEIDFVIVNGENAAGGYGITKKICDELFSVGVDVITSGNHIWDQKETADFISTEKRLLRPLNLRENHRQGREQASALRDAGEDASRGRGFLEFQQISGG